MVEKNVLRNQLQTGNFEMTTLRGAVKDSGAFDVTLEEDEQGDDHVLDLQDGNRPIANVRNKKCHRGTQTDFSSFLKIADFPVHETIEDTHL